MSRVIETIYMGLTHCITAKCRSLKKDVDTVYILRYTNLAVFCFIFSACPQTVEQPFQVGRLKHRSFDCDGSLLHPVPTQALRCRTNCTTWFSLKFCQEEFLFSMCKLCLFWCFSESLINLVWSPCGDYRTCNVRPIIWRFSSNHLFLSSIGYFFSFLGGGGG